MSEKISELPKEEGASLDTLKYPIIPNHKSDKSLQPETVNVSDYCDEKNRCIAKQHLHT